MTVGKKFQTIQTLLNRNAMLYPETIGLIEAEGDRAHSYRLMKDRANRLGNALYDLGAQKGDRIAILSQNSLENMESGINVPNAGLALVPCNFRLAPPEIIAVLNDAEPVILIAQDQFVSMVEQITGSVQSIKHLIYVGSPENRPEGWHDYEELIREGSPEDIAVEIFEDDIATLMYTSGTTGVPKGVMQTHGNMYHTGRICSRLNNMGMDDRAFIVGPMYHIISHYTFFGGLYAACPVYVFKKWDVELFLSVTEKVKLTSGMLATPMVTAILDSPDHKKYDVSSWKSLVVTGSGIIPRVFKRFIDTFGHVMGECYGTTETTGTITHLSVGDIAEAFDRGDYDILESCGRPTFDMEILIVDEKDKPVPAGGVGEMTTRGPGVSLGYWRKEEETKKGYVGEWFRTQDICSIDDRGYIRIVGRSKDMIITGGENVYPIEVEAVINTHPSVKECCVIGLPDPNWGEVVTAVCIAENPETTLQPEEVINYCRGRIAGYKVPKRVYAVPSMPRNASGKILKAQLKEQIGG